MPYRPLRHVLGETNLERKCRLLFGPCLFFSIFIAFLLVDYVAEKLVVERQLKVVEAGREQGAAYVDMSLMKQHFREIGKFLREAQLEQGAETDADEDWEQWRERWLEWEAFLTTISEEFDNQGFQYSLIADGKAAPADDWERENLARLAEFAKAQQAENPTADPSQSLIPEKTTSDDPREAAESALSMFARRGIATLYVERLDHTRGELYYYQPIFYKDKCRICHHSLAGVGALSAAEGGVPFEQSEPVQIAKVVVPLQSEMTAESQIRAILLAVGVGAWFLAMMALYVIVRYVIIKPLGHLREVSEEISRGKTERRADLETRDEFQDLAESFNRMIRHLTDAQRELEGANENLDAKVDELAQLNMRLYEMNRLKDDFLANMSHELRTPLNSIIGFSEVLHGIDSLNDKQKRYASNIQKSGRVLLEMINDILDLAKIEAGKMEVRLTEFRIGALIEAQCDMVRSLTDEKNIDLAFEALNDEEPMYQDQAKVLQILTNLLSNAIKFTPEGGRIVVQAERTDDERLVLSVADTGVGIAEEDRRVIFEKFRQSRAVLENDGLTREYSGTGLGLSIVKELCKLLGGEIMVTSQLGKGSTFTVTLPWSLSEVSKSKLSSKLDEITRATSLDGGRDALPDRFQKPTGQTATSGGNGSSGENNAGGESEKTSESGGDSRRVG